MPVPDQTVRVFIENEAGSATKNSYDERTLEFISSATVSRPYPYPYGFVLDTRSGDGDAVDCFVITRKILRSGDVVNCVPMHLLEQIEDGEVDHKVLCVPAGSQGIVEELAVAEIRDFVMSVFTHIPGKSMQLGSLLGTAEAVKFISRSKV